MAITYPITPPLAPVERSLVLSGRSVVAITQSPFTLSQQIQAFGGEQWSFSMTLPPMARAEAEEWVAFLFKLKGRQGTFLLGPYHGRAARGTVPGMPSVDGANQTGNELDTTGWTANQTGILLAGDFVQLNSGGTTSLHKILEDADSDGAGDSTLLLWPSIRTSPADMSVVVVTNPVGHWLLVSNLMSYSVDVAQHYGLTIEAEEAL